MFSPFARFLEATPFFFESSARNGNSQLSGVGPFFQGLPLPLLAFVLNLHITRPRWKISRWHGSGLGLRDGRF